MIGLAKLRNEFRQSNNRGQFLRASELPSPAPAGHFLREFGQSDREQIDNSNTEPAVTQVLSMMNGYVEQRISRDDSSLLMQAVLSAKDVGERTETVFLSMLNRKPDAREAAYWARQFKNVANPRDLSQVKEVYSDLIWVLANSNEFVFVK